MSIVVIGTFNPAIFQPSWFGAEGLITPTEADGAAVEIIHPDAAFFTAGWLRVQVLQGRLLMSTTQTSHSAALRDLAASTLHILGHTPAVAVGVNHDEVVRFTDRKVYDELGWGLVPPDRWPGLIKPGLATLIEQGDRDDGRSGWIRVTVAPVLEGTLDVKLGVNDHVSFGTVPAASVTAEIVTMLSDEWSTITRRAEALLEVLR